MNCSDAAETGLAQAMAHSSAAFQETMPISPLWITGPLVVSFLGLALQFGLERTNGGLRGQPIPDTLFYGGLLFLGVVLSTALAVLRGDVQVRGGSLVLSLNLFGWRSPARRIPLSSIASIGAAQTKGLLVARWNLPGLSGKVMRRQVIPSWRAQEVLLTSGQVLVVGVRCVSAFRDAVGEGSA